MERTNKAKKMEVEIHKHKTRQGRGILYK